MSKYVMLECNRLNGRRQVGGIDESQDTYKNKWTNNVNSSGIQIDPGDTITCEASAINTVGAADSTLEYTGEENRNGYIDNKCSMSMAYYVNDSGFNMVKLPLVSTRTSFGYFPRISADQPPTAQYPIQPITTYLDNPHMTENVLDYMASRSVGEPYLDTYSKAPFHEGVAPQLLNDLPGEGLVYSVKLDKAHPGVNYRINGTYVAMPINTNQSDPNDPQYIGYIATKMTIDVLDVMTETGYADMPSQIRIRDPGDGYLLSACPFNLYVWEAVDGGSNGNNLQQFTVKSYMNENFKTKCSAGADGRRYYFGDTKWTGSALTQYTGEPENQALGQDMGSLNPNFRYRQTQLDLEVPIGLSTPDNLATLITDQLHAPTRMTLERSLDPQSDLGFDYKSFKVRSVLADDAPEIIRPPVITTPTFTLFPSGASYSHKDQRMDSLAGARRQYYGVLGNDNPDKFAGLQFSRQLYYGLTNDILNNQVNSGTFQRPNVGDFQNQTVGILGMNQALMMEIPNDPANTKLKKLNKGDWVLTNQYFTESNVRTLSEGLKKCEMYYDNLNEVVDPYSDKYKKGLGVAMDIGLYVDEISNAYPLTPPSQSVGETPYPIPNQRTRFRSMSEVRGEGDNLGLKFIDFGNAVDPDTQQPNGDVCVGNIPFGAFVHRDGIENNDGQELSSIVFTARYDGDEIFNNSDIAPNYQRLYDIIAQPGDGSRFTVAGQSIGETFNRKYTDPDPTIGTKSTEDLLALAKKYDVAIIPVFPAVGRTDEYKFGGRPYIAFKSHYDCGANAIATDVFNTSNPSRSNGLKWAIDGRNAGYGLQLGLDTSSIRNNLALCYNTNYASMLQPKDIKTYCPLLYMGAVNPSLNFNSTLSRFEWSGWNTPYTIGNGMPGSNQYILDATGNPEQQSYAVNQPQSVVDIVPGNAGTPMVIQPPDGGTPITISNLITRGASFWNQSNPSSFLESLSGLSFIDLKLYDGNGDASVMNFKGSMNQGLPYDSSKNYYLYWGDDNLTDTLFGKMGFTMRQFLPIIGRPNSQFTNPLTFRTSYGAIKNELLRTPLPMTTGAYISSAEFQPTGTNSQDMPLYNLYPNMGLPSQPAVEQGTITAFNLPSKLDYPYMLIYSSVMTNGTDTEYYGGVDGKSKLPCIGYITRNYNSGDFFYSLEQGFNYTANKNFVITDIETELRLPNGLRPRLQPHSSVIYKITKPLQQLPPPSVGGPPSPKARAKRSPPKDQDEEDEDEDEDQ